MPTYFGDTPLAGADSLLLSDVDVFADDAASTPSAPPVSAANTPPSTVGSPPVTSDIGVVNCTDQPIKIRPTVLYVTCADGGIMITNIKWQAWGRPIARGSGELHVNDCNPDCADGHTRTVPARVILSEPSVGSEQRRYTVLDAIPPEGDSFHVTLPA